MASLGPHTMPLRVDFTGPLGVLEMLEIWAGVRPEIRWKKCGLCAHQAVPWSKTERAAIDIYGAV